MTMLITAKNGFCASIATILFLASAPSALGQDTPPNGTTPTDPAVERQIDRTWLYADDAHVAAPLTVIGMTSASYTTPGSSPTRADSPFGNTFNAFAANTAQPGIMMSMGGEVGIVSHVSVMALGQVGVGAEGSSPNAGALAGARFQLFPREWTNSHLALSAGYLREAWEGPVYDEETGKWYPGNPHGDNGAWLQLAFSQDMRRLRVATTLHTEHIFADGRDPVDLMVELGATYRIIGGFRAGLEYVGQDLEEAFTPGAEAGARHFAGPVASLQLLQDRLTIVAGPAIGLSSYSPQFLGRLGVAYGF